MLQWLFGGGTNKAPQAHRNNFEIGENVRVPPLRSSQILQRRSNQFADEIQVRTCWNTSFHLLTRAVYPQASGCCLIIMMIIIFNITVVLAWAKAGQDQHQVPGQLSLQSAAKLITNIKQLWSLIKFFI